MSSTTPEQPKPQITPDQFLSAIQEKVRQMTPEEIAKAIPMIKEKAASLKVVVDASVHTKGHGQVVFEGDANNKDSPKAKAQSVKEVVQEVLTAMKTPGKELSPSLLKQVTPADETTGKAILTRLSQAFPDVNNDITEQTAPYIFNIIQKAMNGEITSPQAMENELSENRYLQGASPEAFKKVQNAFVEAAKDMGTSESAAKERFSDSGLNKKGANGIDERDWQQTYGSYFNPSDRGFVESLYTPTKFVEFIREMQVDKAKEMGKDVHSKEVHIEVSKDIERKIVDLFGKLYTRLDQEKPSEFFHEIEQQDIMRGILPVKNELKRRMTLLATELDQAIYQGIVDDPHLWQSAEVEDKIADLQYKTLNGESRTKGRHRLNPYTEPVESHGGHFIHYLDQIADHYIEARKYTHNARAIFLHPVDPEKGFYSQLKQFSEEMTTVDFDQMMALPDNEVFRDAFSLYDKMVEEKFATNDWKHFPTMFELKQNSLRNQIEEDVFEKLKLMYSDQLGKKGGMTEARLEAALSMAVGASRGMFLTEIEKAAYADPHVTEEGKNTFASYYNQDNSALIAFNPMHFHLRWQTQNTIDPVLFTPVEGTDKGSKYASMFSDHRDLWKKMQGFRDSFINGRVPTGLEGQTLFSDFLMNVGRVGGPLQRKGWRTSYMLEPLYIRDPDDATGQGYDMLKSWQRLENIGYEAAQDYVEKIDGRQKGFIGAYKGAVYEKKAELFKYIYGKYFDAEPEGMERYMKGLRSEVKDEVLQKIRAGKSAPKDIREEIEKEASTLFLFRGLARMISERIPTKILRLDRDRFSKNGISRWRQIALDMELSTQDFDALMQDLLMGEQLLRKEVSKGMHDMVDKHADPWHHGDIEYKLTEEKLGQLLKGKLSAERVAKVQELLRNIHAKYTKNNEFLDKILTPSIKDKDKRYPFTFAVDEVDLSFIPWRGGGARVLPRAISDIATVEKSVAGELTKLPKTLAAIATDGKRDFTPIIEIMKKCYGSIDAIIGTDYAMHIVHNIAAMTINYFKKDTQARWFYGLFGLGRTNSLAAERVGRGRAWEWDSTDIDRFCYTLETNALLELDGFNVSNSKPEYTPIYVNLPFLKTPVKLPQSVKLFGKEIKLFQKRKPDYEWTTKKLRDKFGGNWKDITFDYINKYLPFVIAWLMWKYISDALKESEGKKK